MQAAVKNKCPDVQFILEALAGSLTDFTEEGDFLLEDQNLESLKNGPWAVVSPIDSILSKNHQAEACSPTQHYVWEPMLSPRRQQLVQEASGCRIANKADQTR